MIALFQTQEEENVLVKNPETKEFQMFKISKEDNKKLKSDNITDIENAPLFNTLDNKETKKDENNKFVSIDLEDSNDSKPIPLDKPIKINHQGHEKILINILLNGMENPIVINGKTYNGLMPSHSFLKDEELALVHNYMKDQMCSHSDYSR